MHSGEFRRTLPALVAAVPITLIFVAVLSVLLTAASPKGLGLTTAQTSSWIAVLYGLPAIPSLVLTFRYRQPMLLTGNVFAIIFFASLGDRISFSELVGASFLAAGAIVLLGAAFGLTGRLAAWIPAPIVHGLIAGAIMPFVADVFSGLSTFDEHGGVSARVPVMVGSALLAYLLSQRFFGPRLPAIFPALVAGLAVAGLTGQFGHVPTSLALPDLAITRPAFSLPAVATATPVLVALITLQSNLPSVIYMRSQGYHPPERAINVWSGIGTMVASFIGPVAVSLAVPLVPLTAGPTAGGSLGPLPVRLPSRWCAPADRASGPYCGRLDGAGPIGPASRPGRVGFGWSTGQVSALREVTRGPLLLGPIFAFAIALSNMSLLGLGPFFWSLVLGAVSALLEPEEWKQLRAGVVSSDEAPAGRAELGFPSRRVVMDAPLVAGWGPAGTERMGRTITGSLPSDCHLWARTVRGS